MSKMGDSKERVFGGLTEKEDMLKVFIRMTLFYIMYLVKEQNNKGRGRDREQNIDYQEITELYT